MMARNPNPQRRGRAAPVQIGQTVVSLTTAYYWMSQACDGCLLRERRNRGLDADGHRPAGPLPPGVGCPVANAILVGAKSAAFPSLYLLLAAGLVHNNRPLDPARWLTRSCNLRARLELHPGRRDTRRAVYAYLNWCRAEVRRNNPEPKGCTDGVGNLP